MKKSMTLISCHREVMTLSKAQSLSARGAMSFEDLSLQKKMSFVIEESKIVWIGKKSKLPRSLRAQIQKEVNIDGNIFPGFIDCHTHTLFAGDRVAEFELKNKGVSYQTIAQNGGGISHTVQQSRSASDKKINTLLKQRLDLFLNQGVTTVEVKTGYGLNTSSERRFLKILNHLEHSIEVIPTFLGAHAVPSEFSNEDLYLQSLKNDLIEIQKKKLAHRVDIFIEKGFFSSVKARDYLLTAKKMGFDLVIHADQLSLCGGAELAIDLGAVSADHLICIEDQQIQRLSKSEVTGVLLPAADFYSHCPYPPARKMIDSGCRVALATDFNPGTSPTQNIQFVGLLARTMMKMTLPEVFVALTLGAAYALREQNRLGALMPGYQADFFVANKDWDQFFYDLSETSLDSVWKKGKKVKK